MQDWGTEVTAAQEGDLTAFTAVVRRFEDMAVGYAYALLGDRDSAQDAAQEAFIEAYLCLKGLREPYAFPAWLRRIVQKQCDRMSRRKKVATVPLEAAGELPTRQPGPLEALEREEARRAVVSALRSLPEHERTTTTLFYIDGYSLTEIGDFLEVPVGTVKRRLHTARQKLRERMMGLVEETLKQQAPDGDVSRRVARVLEGIGRIHWTETSCLCFVGSVLACMRYLGDEVEGDYVMGISGGAFSMYWIPPWSPANCDLLDIGEEPIRRTFAALGYGYTFVADHNHESAARAKEVYRPLITASIDAGRPVIALGVVGPPEACVIAGYDKGGDVLYGRSYFEGNKEHGDTDHSIEKTGYFRAEEWAPHCHGLVLIGDKKGKPDARGVVRETLEWAVELARTREFPKYHIAGDEPHTVISGLAAYDAMAEGLERDEDFPAADLETLTFRLYALANDGIYLMACKRGAAARFCASTAKLGLPIAGLLEEAAVDYGREAAVWSRAAGMVAYTEAPAGKRREIADPKLRRRLSALVREAKGHGEEAIQHLEEALGKLAM